MVLSYKLRTTIEVDEGLCNNCGFCIMACPGGLITKEQFPVPTANTWDECIDCGHCVAICPTGAIQQRSMGPEDCKPVDARLVLTWDQVKNLMTTRRAIRNYQDKPVEKEKILKLLDVTRWAPNGANRQVLHWLVIKNPKKIYQIAEMTIDWMRSTKDSNPRLYQEAKLGLFINAWEAGKDQISRGAPCLIMVHAEKDERTASPSAMIAIAHIALAAPTLGLGTTFSGSINVASQFYSPLIDALGIPEGHIPFGSFVMGYPAEKYMRIPLRKPVEVTWL